MFPYEQLKKKKMASSSEKKDENYYFKKRKNRPNRAYITKEFPYTSYQTKRLFDKKRFINKVILNKEETEVVRINGELILRSSFNGAIQVRVIVYTNDVDQTMSFTLQKFFEQTQQGVRPVKQSNFTFRQEEWHELLVFLNEIQFIDLSNKNTFSVDLPKTPKKISLNLNNKSVGDIEETISAEELVGVIQNLDDEQRKTLLELSQNRVFTKYELDVLSGRKRGLEEFESNLDKDGKNILKETEWQFFFESNSWIFGYGLDYKFLKILQKEATISDTDLDGKESVITDFLLGDNRFTTIVELKRPDTKIFEQVKNRSKSWRLSTSLTYSISQILTQKAEWELKSQKKQYDSEDNLIHEYTIDPKAILIIGHTSQFYGEDRESTIKAKTFELYRRNLRNIEIITFDELLERARFIIKNDKREKENFPSINKFGIELESEGDDDLPF